MTQGKSEALETIVQTRRGLFTMTVIEGRFPGSRFDYEVKYTLESKRFDALAPALCKSLDSFRELPGPAPGGDGECAVTTTVMASRVRGGAGDSMCFDHVPLLAIM